MTLAGRYTPIETLDAADGREVVLARDVLTGAQVVVKRVSARASDALRSSLRAEFDLLRAIDHPGVVRVEDLAASDSGELLLVEERVDGEPVARAAGTADDRREWAARMSSALAFVHACGAVHGDISPSNVLVRPAAEAGSRGRAVLVDFGLGAFGRRAHAAGTGGFVAPEVLRGQPAGAPADVFSLGKVLEELLRDVAGGAADVIAAMTHDDPGKRPSSREVARALGAQTLHVPWPFVGRETQEQELAGATGVLVLEGAPGAGRTRLLRRLAARLRLAGHSVLLVPPSARAASLGPELVAGATVLFDDLDLAHADLRDRAIEVAASDASPLVVLSAWPELARALGDRVPLSQTLSLEPLDRAAVYQIAQAVLGDHGARAERLLEESGGLPGVLAAILERRGEDSPTAHARALAVLHALSGAGASAEVVRAILGTWGDAPRDAARALDDACAAGLVRIGPPVTPIAARLAERAWNALDAASRSTLHAACARALDERGLPDVVLHRVLAGDRDAAARAPEVANDLVARGDPGRALALLEAAERPDDPAWAEALASAADRAGAFDRGAAALARAAGESHDPAARRMLIARLATIEERRGDFRKALELARESGAAAAESRALLALGDTSAAASVAARALEVAPETAPERFDLTIALAQADLRGGRVVEARALLSRALANARAAGDLRREAVALGHSGIAAQAAGDRDQAAASYAAAVEAAEKAGDIGGLPAHLLNLATACHEAGAYARALVLLRRAEELSRKTGRVRSLAMALVNLGNLYGVLGAQSAAERRLREADAAAVRAGLRAVRAQVALCRAEIHTRAGSAEAAAHVRAAADAFAALGDRAKVAEVGLLSGELALANGDEPRAREAGEAAEAHPHLRARALLLRARADAIRGDLEGASGRLTAAREEARALGDRELEATIVAEAARIASERGSPLAAHHAATALELFEEAALRAPEELRAQYVGEVRRRAIVDRCASLVRAPASSGLEEKLERLLGVARRIIAEHEPARVLEVAMDTAVEITGAERGFLLLRPERVGASADGKAKKGGRGGGGSPTVAVARNLDRETVRHSSGKFSRSIAEQVLGEGRSMLFESASQDERLREARSVHVMRLQSILCVPVRGRDRVEGALYLDNRLERGRFGESDLRIAQHLADLVAVALENARLHREQHEREAELERARSAAEELAEIKSAEVQRLESEVERARTTLGLRYDYGSIIGRSDGMRRVLEMLDKVTESTIPVLVLGESGTGKELIARALHFNGPRRKQPFVSINCSALSPTLIESELFGHARGAFTGAVRDRIGLFREADGGTLFLDEIGDMPLDAQARLLRVLQFGEVRPVGSDAAHRVDVRVAAATNRALESLVRRGGFREDLYYRLAGVTLQLPPLRERREDVPVLAEHILRKETEREGLAPKRLAADALTALSRHTFPGNVRELENILRAASVMADGAVIRARDLPLRQRAGGAGTGGAAQPGAGARRTALREVDRQFIEEALRKAKGSRTRAAALLGVSRPTLYRKLRDYGLL